MFAVVNPQMAEVYGLQDFGLRFKPSLWSFIHKLFTAILIPIVAVNTANNRMGDLRGTNGHDLFSTTITRAFILHSFSVG